MFLEPVRFEFHGTSMNEGARWAAAIPRLRVGMLVYSREVLKRRRLPRLPECPPRISRDWVLNVGLFFDIGALAEALRVARSFRTLRLRVAPVLGHADVHGERHVERGGVLHAVADDLRGRFGFFLRALE